ncbi:MAG: UMP kinase [Clostridia bacterium]|nr:UMP kinase [Clostridia bacterium]
MYKRVLLKLSGEAFAGEQKLGIDPETINMICRQIKEVREKGVQIGIVVGGGNFWRGKYAPQMKRVDADMMGMLATELNGLALKDSLEKMGVPAVVQSALDIPKAVEFYKTEDTNKYLKDGKVVIFTGGTGNPFFSTDTGAAIRAAEIEADVILVAKTIDGVYSADPKLDPSAVKYDEISYIDVLTKELKVMDLPAISLCMENSIQLSVFSMYEDGNIVKAVEGENIGTVVR